MLIRMAWFTFLIFLSASTVVMADRGNAAAIAAEPMMLEQSESATHQKSFSNKDRSTFSRLYKKYKRPKIVILFNQQLSGDVNDWRENSRLVISDETKISMQRKNNNNRQVNFPQQWIWQFEQGFVEIFESLGVRLIDLNTAKRLTASSQMDTSPGLSGMVGSLKKNEIDAISNYANYYIELVIISSQQSDFGYQLKASMINSKTGEIIARVNSLSWRQSGAIVYQASKYGYQEKTNNYIINKNNAYGSSKQGYIKNQQPEIAAIANYLAEKLIKKINTLWSN
ncbi:MAG: hypothetical protein QM479_14285 [Pseudomonadota bacterium]